MVNATMDPSTVETAASLQEKTEAMANVTPALERSTAAKWCCTIIVACMAGVVSFSSSVQTPAIEAMSLSLGASHELVTFAASSAYLLGFGIGPFLFSPLSEAVGRKRVYASTFLVFVCMQLGCSLTPNVAALAVFRFIAGFMGGPTVANAGGSVTDVWHHHERSLPLAVYTVACYIGPVLAPLVGGVLTQYAGWRWNFWLVLILSAVNYLIMVLVLPETYLTTPNTAGNEKGVRSLSQVDLKGSFARPWIMIAKEPILLALSTLMAFIYGVLFLDFSAFPIVFVQERHWSLAVAGLSFLGIGLGMLIATALSPLLDRQYGQLMNSSTTGRLEPEIRLRHLIFIAWLLPASLFWFAWSALPPTHWIVPILSGLPFGLSLALQFLGINAYLIDCYGRYSASALGANTLLRSAFGAGFALFANQLYDRLGTPWATSLLAFIALGLAPMPLILYKVGPWLRQRSKFHQAAVGK